MNNTKTTKRALLSSVMAMLICVAMLIGTTFAWFTDTASTAVNKIQAGTLRIGLEMKDDSGNWVNAEGKTLQFKVNGQIPAEGTQILWEPGCTYELPTLRIINYGNLALKYKVTITGIKGSAKLNDAIEWTIGDVALGTEQRLAVGHNNEFTISGNMKEDAGNEYQGLSIDGIGITVVATQDTVEYDSNNNIYDTDATYLNTDAQGNNYFISNANELVYFAKTVNVDGETYAGKTVKLTADIDLAGKIWIPVGQTQVSSFQGTFDGQDHTIKNMTVNYTGTNSNYACGLFGWIELHNGAPIVIQNVKFDNANVTGIKYTGVVAGYAHGASGAEIKNCVVTNSTVTSNSKNAGGIIGYMGTGVLTGNTVSGCTISAKYDVGGIANSVQPVVTFQNNKVENTNIYYAEDQTYDAAGIFVCGKVSGITIDNTNTSSNVTVNKLVAVSTAEQLSSALNATYNADITLKLANDINLSGEWGGHKLDATNNAKLTIDGNGKTIYGLTSSSYYNLGGFNSNGLVTNIGAGFSSVTFKNLTVSGANLTNNGGASAATGVFVGDTNTVNVTFDTCTVIGANVTSDAYAAGFIGFIQDVNTNKKSVKLINCTVTNSTFNGNDATGAMIGANYTNINIDDATVTDNTVNGGNGYSAAALVGTDFSSVTATNVTVSDNTFSGGKKENLSVDKDQLGWIAMLGSSYNVNGTELK